MSHRPSTKALVIGIALAITVNCILVCSSFTVGKIKLVFYEICFVKAFLQTLLYSIIKVVTLLFKQNSQEGRANTEDVNTNLMNSEMDSLAEIKLSERISLTLWVIVFSIASGGMTVAAYIGVQMIPVPDFVVLAHTASLFTLILSTFFLKQKLTPLKLCLCLLVVGGVILVVQPTFIFGSHLLQISKNTTNDQKETTVSPMEPEHKKTIGTIISLLCALSAGFMHVSSAKTNGRVSRLSLMIGGGIGTYIVTMIGYLLMNDSSGEAVSKVTLYERALLTIAVATAAMVAGHLLVIANQNATPTIVAVVRASEILLALLIEKIMFNSRLMSNYTYFGAVCVLLGVSLMSFHMQIQDHIDRLNPCRKRPQLLPVKTENVDST